MSSFKKFQYDQSKDLPSIQQSSSLSVQLPGGCRMIPSGLVVTSTGVSSLDALLADGLPLGSIVAIRQDKYTSFSHMLLKIFAAQGLFSNQLVFLPLVEGKDTLEEFTNQLPSLDNSISQICTDIQNNDQFFREKRLNIAWRYENMPTISPNISKLSSTGDTAASGPPFVLEFDLGKRALKGSFPIENIHTVSPPINHTEDGNKFLEEIIKELNILMETHLSSLINVPIASRRIGRIVLPSFGSLAWNVLDIGVICNFFGALRSMLRYSFCCALVTLPDNIYNNPNVCSFFDCMLGMDSFNGLSAAYSSQMCVIDSTTTSINTTSAVNNDYQGTLLLDKPLKTNSFTPIAFLDTKSYLFKCKRKKFLIEKFYLPPDLSDTPSRTTSTSVENKSANADSCKCKKDGASPNLECGCGCEGKPNEKKSLLKFSCSSFTDQSNLSANKILDF